VGVDASLLTSNRSHDVVESERKEPASKNCLDIQIAPSQSWNIKTVSTELFPEYWRAGPDSLNSAMSAYAQRTVYSSPIPMTTFGARLTKLLPPCQIELGGLIDHCYMSDFFWIPANVQTSKACESITYAIESDTCGPYIYAQYYTIPKAPTGVFGTRTDSCTTASSSSQIESCIGQWYSAQEELFDSRQPKDVGITTITNLLKWCGGCSPPSDHQTKSCLVVGGPGPMAPGAELFFFPPPTSERDMCATVPDMNYKKLLSVAKVKETHVIPSGSKRKSAITMGRTMYEGSVYIRFASMSAVGKDITTTDDNGNLLIYPEKLGTTYEEVWVEAKSEDVSSSRLPDIVNVGREYPLNYAVS